MSNVHAARIATEDGNIVNVYVKPHTLYNYQATQQLTSEILNRFGCRGCHSGLQILFQLEEVEEAELSVEVEA